MKNILVIAVVVVAVPVFSKTVPGQSPADFVPRGFVVFEKINGDLDKDGIDDCVLVINGSDQNKKIAVEGRGKLDRNRRGIIVLLNRKTHYEQLVKNYDCFSSGNEDGGVYYAPELSVEIRNGNLYISYGHGRYGYWRFTFRCQHADLELIGYDQSANRGPVIESETSINFSTGIKMQKTNTKTNAEGGDEIFRETKKKIAVKPLVKLSRVKNFDELDMSVY